MEQDNSKYKRRLKIAIIVFDVIILLAAFAIFTYKSYPPSPLYPIKKYILMKSIAANDKHIERAKAYVAHADWLQHHLFITYKKDPKDSSLDEISKDLWDFEELAIKELDAAKKKSEGDIKDAVEKLCDTLILQHQNLKLAMAQQKTNVTPDMQRLISDTKAALAESHGW